jgi:hypothetical protein
MSVQTLSISKCSIYASTAVQDSCGAVYYTYALKQASIDCRIRYTGGQETVKDGKETLIPTHRIYLPYQVSIVATDIIIDDVTNETYDILYINTCYHRHMQVDCKMIKEIIPFNEIIHT